LKKRARQTGADRGERDGCQHVARNVRRARVRRAGAQQIIAPASGGLSLLVGNRHSLIEGGLIDGLTDSAQSVEPLLTPLILVNEAPDALFDQFIGASIAALGELL
jgi:hypothetical protein